MSATIGVPGSGSISQTASLSWNSRRRSPLRSPFVVSSRRKFPLVKMAVSVEKKGMTPVELSGGCFDAVKVDTLLDGIKWDEKGLVVAIAQNIDTGAVLMQGFANREAIATTLTSRKATFYSRSRSSLWTKGETSLNFINVHDVFLDCDRYSIIYLGKPDGPTCHTGAETCYYKSATDELGHRQRRGRLCEDLKRAASEMADVLYHSMVLLANKGVKIEEVLGILRERFAQSGIEEKSSRKSGQLRSGSANCCMICLAYCFLYRSSRELQHGRSDFQVNSGAPEVYQQGQGGARCSVQWMRSQLQAIPQAWVHFRSL